MSRVGRLLAVVSLLVPAASEGAFHIAVIDELMSGAEGNANIQYVEVRPLVSDQTRVAHTRLTVFRCQSDGGGFQVLIDDLGGASAVNPVLSNGASDARWIMASPDGATFLGVSGITPDFTWNNTTTGNIPVSCGMVCWGAPGNLDPAPRPWPGSDAGDPANYVDCVAYGSYDGVAQPLGHPPTSATPGAGTFSLTKMGDSADANDYALACPSPTSNPAQAMGTFGACTPPMSTTTVTTTSTTVTTTSFPPGAGKPVFGTKLLLRTNTAKPARNGLMLIMKDAGVVVGNPTQSGGSLRVTSTTGDGFDTPYPLPASGWKALGAGKGYRFANAAGPIRLVVAKPGKILKATGKGPDLKHTLAARPDAVSVVLAVGDQRDCASFVNVIKFTPGKKLLARKNPPPAACP